MANIKEEIRRKLEERRQKALQVEEDYKTEAKPERRKDIPDLANEEAKFSVASKLAGFEQLQIKEIEDAIFRLDKGTYGLCETCEEAISPKRLRAMPEARYCITCSRSREDEQNHASTSQHTGRA